MSCDYLQAIHFVMWLKPVNLVAVESFQSFALEQLQCRNFCSVVLVTWFFLKMVLVLLSFAARIYGLIICWQGLLSFLSAPLIGALSDVWGRKFFLLITVFFTCAPIPLMTINTWWVVLWLNYTQFLVRLLFTFKTSFTCANEMLLYLFHFWYLLLWFSVYITWHV